MPDAGCWQELSTEHGVSSIEHRASSIQHRASILCCLALLALAAASATAASRKSLLCTKGEDAPFRLTTPHFDIEFSVPPAVGRRYAALCERAYSNFRKKFHVPDDDVVWEGKCRVRLFAKRDEFVAFARQAHNSPAAAESGGYARITKHNPDIVLHLKGKDHVRLQQVLVHEMTHVFLQLFHREANIETWLHEGFAQYFEFRVQPRKSRLAASRRRAKRLVKSGRAKALREFWKMDFPATDLDSYAQAWSLIDFMVTKGSARRTGRFVLRIKDGLDQEAALAETFGSPLEKFEALWKRYVAETY